MFFHYTSHNSYFVISNPHDLRLPDRKRINSRLYTFIHVYTLRVERSISCVILWIFDGDVTIRIHLANCSNHFPNLQIKP